MDNKNYICPNCNENTLHNSDNGFVCDTCNHTFTSEETEYGGIKFNDITKDNSELVSESLTHINEDAYYSKTYDALSDVVNDINNYFNAVGDNIEDYLNKKGFYKVNDTLYMKQDNYNNSTYTSYIDFTDSNSNINAYVKVNDELVESYEIIYKSLNEASISDMLDDLEAKGKENWTDSDWELFNHIDATKGKYEEVDEESEEEEILTEDFADELKAIAKKYCKEKGYEFLFANDYKFGFEMPDTHQMWTMTYDELKDDLENNPINEDYESGNGLSASANEIYNYIKNVYGFKDITADSVSPLIACRVLIQDAVNQYIVDYGVPSQTIEDYMNKTEFELLAHMLVGDLMEESVIEEEPENITEAFEEVVDDEEAKEDTEEPAEEKSNDFYLKIAFAETSGAPSDDLIAEASEKEFNDINDLNRLLKLADSEFRDYWAQNGGVFGYDKVYIDGYYKIGDDTYKVDNVVRIDLGDGKYGDNYITITKEEVENGRRLAKNAADNISDGYGKVTLVKENVVKKAVKESVVNMQGNPIDKLVFGKYRILVEKDFIGNDYKYSVVGYKSMLAISRKSFNTLEEATRFFNKLKFKINKIVGCDDLDFVTCLEDNYEKVEKIILAIGKI